MIRYHLPALLLGAGVVSALVVVAHPGSRGQAGRTMSSAVVEPIATAINRDEAQRNTNPLQFDIQSLLARRNAAKGRDWVGVDVLLRTMGIRSDLHLSESWEMGAKPIVVDTPLIAAYVSMRACMTIGNNRNDDMDRMLGKPIHEARKEEDTPQRLGARRELERVARAGIAFEPKNGYFHAMLATSLIGQRRDKEAVETIHKAAVCSEWDDHIGEMFGEAWAAYIENGGQRSIASAVYLSASMLMPHFSSIRNNARFAAAYATQLERNGNKEEGSRIRHDIMRVAAHMRGSARNLIGGLVAKGTFQTAYNGLGEWTDNWTTVNTSVPEFRDKIVLDRWHLLEAKLRNYNSSPFRVGDSQWQGIERDAYDEVSKFQQLYLGPSGEYGSVALKDVNPIFEHYYSLSLAGRIAITFALVFLVLAALARLLWWRGGSQVDPRGFLTLSWKLAYAAGHLAICGAGLVMGISEEAAAYSLVVIPSIITIGLGASAYGLKGLLIAAGAIGSLAFGIETPQGALFACAVLGVLAILATNRLAMKASGRVFLGIIPLIIATALVSALWVGLSTVTTGDDEIRQFLLQDWFGDSVPKPGSAPLLPWAVFVFITASAIVGLRSKGRKSALPMIARGGVAVAGLSLLAFSGVTLQAARMEPAAVTRILPDLSDEIGMMERRSGTKWPMPNPFPKEVSR